MKRDALQKMIRWKENPRRMPLLLIGARQVGKTWLMREFGERNYEEVAYLSFDRSKDLRSVFEQGFDVARLLANIRLATGRRVMPEKTLIILDEIQECPAAITSLKYFCEDAPEYHVVAAGSLLGLYAQEGGTGFPVGKVDMLDLYPMNFTEFLEALGEGAFVEVIKRHDWELLRTFSPRLEELLRYYYYVGGMPKAVEDFSQNRDFIAARERQISILRGYRRDFGKHASASETRRITEVWDSIPNYLAQEKKISNRRLIVANVLSNGCMMPGWAMGCHACVPRRCRLAVSWGTPSNFIRPMWDCCPRSAVCRGVYSSRETTFLGSTKGL